MFKVWFYNFEYYSGRVFNDAKAALDYMKSTGFGCSAVLQDYGVVFTYSPTVGLNVYHDDFNNLNGE